MRSMLRLVGGYGPNEAADVIIPQDRILEIDPSEGHVAWLDGASAQTL